MFRAHQGPLLICKQRPDGLTSMHVAALYPGEPFDALDQLPGGFFVYAPCPIEPGKTSLYMPLSDAKQQAERAIDILSRPQFAYR
jgi:hypothetical protein